MKTVLELYKDSEGGKMICEAFQSKILRHISSDIEDNTIWEDENAFERDPETGKYVHVDKSHTIKTRYSFASLVRSNYNLEADWSKVTDDMFMDLNVISHKDIVLRCYRALKAGKSSYAGVKGRVELPGGVNTMLFGFLATRLQFIAYPYHGSFTILRYGRGSSYSSSRSGIDSVGARLSAKELEQKFDQVDTVYALDLKRVNVRELKNHRREAVAGMIPDLDDADRTSRHTLKGELGRRAGGLDYHPYSEGTYDKYCRSLAQAQFEKYKKLAAQAKSNNIDTEAVNKLVQECFDIYMKITRKYTTNLANKELHTYKLQYAEEILSDHQISVPTSGGRSYTRQTEYGLLHNYRYYIDAATDLARGTSYNTDSTRRDLQRYEYAIKLLTEKMRKIAKDFGV